MDLRLDDETSVPVKWVYALLAAGLAFMGTAVGLGMYFGARDARADQINERVSHLEADLASVGLLAGRVDRRLFRLEIKAGVDVPQADRIPASAP